MPISFGVRRSAPLRAWAAGAALTAGLLAASGSLAQPAPPLSLEGALARAAAFDPERAVVAARVAAGEAAVRQAGVRPNPSVGIELENFAGSGDYGLFDRTELTASYQQTLERGGKREARTGVARAQLEATRLRGAVRTLDLLRDVETAYVEALAAEAELQLAEARLAALQDSLKDVTRRVRSARDPLFAGSRAAALVAGAKVDRDQARAAAAAAHTNLAAYWGGGTDFALDVEALFRTAEPSLPATDADTPEMLLLAAERDVALATVRLEQSRTVTDPTVMAGVRYLGQDDAVALVVGGSIPLRRHDANRGGVERARAERNAAEAEIAAARLVRTRQAASLAGRISASGREADRLAAEVIPLAARTVREVRDGFARGGFQYSDAADAEKALFDARARRVAVLRRHHLDRAALDRLTGRHAGLVASSTAVAETR